MLYILCELLRDKVARLALHLLTRQLRTLCSSHGSRDWHRLMTILLSMCARLVASGCSFFQQLFCHKCLSIYNSIDLREGLEEAWDRFKS
jgi:hypothetical protein